MNDDKNKIWVGTQGSSVVTTHGHNPTSGMHRVKGFTKASDAEKYKKVLRELLRTVLR